MGLVAMHAAHLRARLQQDRVLLCPGVYDALSAALAAEAGFEALYLSGANIAYTLLGEPDIGLVSMTEVADVMAGTIELYPTARSWPRGCPRAACACWSGPAHRPSSLKTRLSLSAAAILTARR